MQPLRPPSPGEFRENLLHCKSQFELAERKMVHQGVEAKALPGTWEHTLLKVDTAWKARYIKSVARPLASNARNCRRWRKVRAHYATVGEALRVNLKILKATTKPNSESD